MFNQATQDLISGFQSPPRGYGEVSFYWWIGDPLTRERLGYQLDRLSGLGIEGLQINYAHSDQGGLSYGLSFPSDPPVFSEDWWELVGWLLQEGKERGFSVSLSDYTLGLGQGFFLDDAIKENPELPGFTLSIEIIDNSTSKTGPISIPADAISLTSFDCIDDQPVAHTMRDLMQEVHGNQFDWHPSSASERLYLVRAVRVPVSLDPMHPESGSAFIRHFFQRFADRFPGETGKGINFFFSDELEFRLRGHLWNNDFAAEFRSRKGYDVLPELAALFVDIGPRTPKIRLDYRDVMVALSEERFFIPVYNWHQERGMTYGCDHGGRGKDITEFGDYFRAMRWYQAPGCDQPMLQADVVKNKVNSSIAHLYERPRVWLEGFYSSGWGTSSADITRATVRNFLQGHNLLSLHGLYYTTHGGWWEWAPPCNHFRMPYWKHIKPFMDGVRRMSYLFSQGVHVCDVAVLYPVAAAEADVEATVARETSFAAVDQIYRAGIDVDFIDFESIERATITGGKLHVAGESYRVLVLPAMRVVRHSTLLKAQEFQAAGGIVIAIGTVPEATDNSGRDDPEVERLVQATFGVSAGYRYNADGPLRSSVLSTIVPDVAGCIDHIQNHVPADIKLVGGVLDSFLHRRIGNDDIYAVYGANVGAECIFRSVGQVFLCDPWTGDTTPVNVVAQSDTETCLRLPLGETNVHILRFTPGVPKFESVSPEKVERVKPLSNRWRSLPEPTLDNTWGDFRIPASAGALGPEARFVRYRAGNQENDDWTSLDYDDSAWDRVTNGFGPKFLQLGPLPASIDSSAIAAMIGNRTSIRSTDTVVLPEGTYSWSPYSYSWREGVEHDPGHQGYHGLKEESYDTFLRFGELEYSGTGTVRLAPAEPSYTLLWTTVRVSEESTVAVLRGGSLPTAVWINGEIVSSEAQTVVLQAGVSTVLLQYSLPSTGYFLLVTPEFQEPVSVPGSLTMRWHDATGIVPFDIYGDNDNPTGCYRFRTAPGTSAMTVTTTGTATVSVDGQLIDAGKTDVFTVKLQQASQGESVVALEIAHERGEYGGAALPAPIAFICEEGELHSGDWSQVEGLATYSGGMWYRQSFVLAPEESAQSVHLDLGTVVASAEIRVNGVSFGPVLFAPYRWDITSAIVSGTNQLEVLVYNTLANHYATIPTYYRGESTSGLIGPANLILQSS